MSLSLVIVTDGKHLDNLSRTINSVRDIIQETVIVYQGTDSDIAIRLNAMSDFSVQTTPKGNADLERNFAYGMASGDFILALDDDEWVPEETKKFMVQIMSSKANVIWFNFKNLVDGVDIKDILGDDPHPRLWRKIEGLISWPLQAHTFPTINSPFMYFTAKEIVHDRKFDELEARHLERGKVVDEKNAQLEKRFLDAVKHKLGKK